MKEKLSHLSEKQINELIERYYNKEKVSDLIAEYNLDIRPNQLVKHFPPEILEIECKHCGNNLIRARVSRDNSHWHSIPEFCYKCGHINVDFCSCDNCRISDMNYQEESEREKQNFIDIWLTYYDDEKIDIKDLSFTDKIYLGAFLREGLSEDYNYIKPIEEFINPLAPTSEFRSKIIDRLVEIDAIHVHKNTDPDLIEIVDYDKGSYKYYTYKVLWALNIKKGELNKVPLIESIINPNDLIESDYEEAFLLWKKIALYESLEYFEHSTSNILGIDYKIGEKTRTVISDLVNDYSVSQIYGILYKSTNNALRFQVEKEVSMRHASNTIVGNAQSFGERAKVNKWELQKYNRIKNCPQSALSKFFFERVIKIGYDGFNEVPRLDLIKN